MTGKREEIPRIVHVVGVLVALVGGVSMVLPAADLDLGVLAIALSSASFVASYFLVRGTIVATVSGLVLIAITGWSFAVFKVSDSSTRGFVLVTGPFMSYAVVVATATLTSLTRQFRSSKSNRREVSNDDGTLAPSQSE